MRINKIQLQNIKSYIDQTIEFYDGVNFISGINGSGKTTIIESIGYALFDVKPYDFKEFVRYGESTGQISIWFEANDEREYLVVRKFGKSKHINWIIYDVESDMELCEGQDDVLSWLMENLGIDRDTDPEKLFEDIIGVKQGMFSTPFLLPPQKRNDLFNPILKLDSYRRAFEATRACQSELEKRIVSLEHQIELDLKEIEGYDEKQDQLNKVIEIIEKLDQEINSLQRTLQENQDRYSKLKRIKESAEERGRLVDKLESEIKSKENLLARVEEDIQKAKEAVEILQKTEHGYNKYVEAEKRFKVLQSDKKRRDQLESEKNKIEHEYTSLRVQIETDERNYAMQRSELAQRLEEAQNEFLEAENQINVSKEEVQQKQSVLENISNIGKRIEILRGFNMDLKNTLVQIEGKFYQIRSKNEDRSEIIRRIKDYPHYKAIADELGKLREELDAERDSISRIRQMIKTAQENKKKSKGGKCPFLEEECKNIEGNLEEYFSKQIDELQEKLKIPEARGEELAQKLELAEQASKTITSLDKDREQVQIIDRQILELRKNAFDLENQIDILQIKDECDAISEGLKADHDTLSLMGFEVMDRISSLNNIARDSESLELRIEGYKLLEAGTDRYLSSAQDSFNAISANARDELDKASKNLTMLEANRNSIDKEIESLKRKLSVLEDNYTRIKDKKDFLKQKEIALQGKREELSEYNGIDEKLAQVEQEQNTYKTDYEEYVRNQKTAGRLAELEEQRSENLSQIQQKQDEAIVLRIEKESLMAEFDPDIYSELDNNIRDIDKGIASRKATLTETARRQSELETQIREMDQVKEHIKQLEDKLNKHNLTFEVLQFVREKVLNEAGDQIADVYRQNVSVKANEIYRLVSNENVNLEWEDEYEVVLTTKSGSAVRRRIFKQLSGGEQMSAALAIRLALLGMLSSVKIGIFDEPTANMDEHRRFNLAQVIPSITEDFRQLFVISHDDSFDSITENIIHLRKTEADGTILAET